MLSRLRESSCSTPPRASGRRPLGSAGGSSMRIERIIAPPASASDSTQENGKLSDRCHRLEDELRAIHRACHPLATSVALVAAATAEDHDASIGVSRSLEVPELPPSPLAAVEVLAERLAPLADAVADLRVQAAEPGELPPDQVQQLKLMTERVRAVVNLNKQLQERVRECDASEATAGSELTETKKTLEQASEEMAAIEQELDDAKHGESQARAASKELSNDLTEARREIEQMSSELTRMQRRSEAAASDLARASGEGNGMVRVLEKENLELYEQISTLRQEIHDLQEKLDE